MVVGVLRRLEQSLSSPWVEYEDRNTYRAQHRELEWHKHYFDECVAWVEATADVRLRAQRARKHFIVVGAEKPLRSTHPRAVEAADPLAAALQPEEGSSSFPPKDSKSPPILPRTTTVDQLYEWFECIQGGDQTITIFLLELKALKAAMPSDLKCRTAVDKVSSICKN